MITPLNDNILLELIEEKEEITTESGIILTQGKPVSSSMRKAKVMAVNEDCESMKAGDVVYIPGMNLAAALVEVDGREMYLVIEKTIVAKE
jgi:co-chaperonin GroES (HSP10)